MSERDPLPSQEPSLASTDDPMLKPPSTPIWIKLEPGAYGSPDPYAQLPPNYSDQFKAYARQVQAESDLGGYLKYELEGLLLVLRGLFGQST